MRFGVVAIFALATMPALVQPLAGGPITYVVSGETSGMLGSTPCPTPTSCSLSTETRRTSPIPLRISTLRHPTASPANRTRVSFTGGKPRAPDGPFMEAKAVVGGCWMIQVKSKEQAIEWAPRCPASNNEIIEIRQVSPSGLHGVS